MIPTNRRRIPKKIRATETTIETRSRPQVAGKTNAGIAMTMAMIPNRR